MKFIVGLGPGSAQDIAARLFGDQLSKRWGQPVVIENKPGADGINAINAFISAHDTHTLLFAASGTFTAHPTQYAKLPYDPTDLVPLARVSSTIIAVAVPTALNVNTLDELVALARKEPGKLNLAPTPGTTEITFDNFMKTAGITMTKIPYGDITKALTDLSENRVQVIVSGIAVVKSQVEAGKVKLLAVTSLKRACVRARSADRHRSRLSVAGARRTDRAVRPEEPAGRHGRTDRRRRAGGRRRSQHRPAACRHRPAARSGRHRRVRGGGGSTAPEHCGDREGVGDSAGCGESHRREHAF